MLVNAGTDFSVSAQAEESGWKVYIRDRQGDRALLDIEGKTTAIFDVLEAVEQRLLGLGIQHFEVGRCPECGRAEPAASPHGALIWRGRGSARKKLTYPVLSCCVKPQITLH